MNRRHPMRRAVLGGVFCIAGYGLLNHSIHDALDLSEYSIATQNAIIDASIVHRSYAGSDITPQIYERVQNAQSELERLTADPRVREELDQHDADSLWDTAGVLVGFCAGATGLVTAFLSLMQAYQDRKLKATR